MALKSISSLVDVAKLKADYMEAMIGSEGQIPDKLSMAVKVDQLKKLLDADPFHPFSPNVKIKYYNNLHTP